GDYPLPRAEGVSLWIRLDIRGQETAHRSSWLTEMSTDASGTTDASTNHSPPSPGSKWSLEPSLMSLPSGRSQRTILLKEAPVGAFDAASLRPPASRISVSAETTTMSVVPAATLTVARTTGEPSTISTCAGTVICVVFVFRGVFLPPDRPGLVDGAVPIPVLMIDPSFEASRPRPCTDLDAVPSEPSRKASTLVLMNVLCAVITPLWPPVSEASCQRSCVGGSAPAKWWSACSDAR